MAEFRSISERVAAVKKELSDRLPHDSEYKVGGQVRYTYSSSDAVLDKLRPLMATEGLDVRPSIPDFRVETRGEGKEGKAVATMRAEFSLACPGTMDACNPTGETVERPSSWWIEHPYHGPQTAEAMVTYLEKMFLKARFQLSTGVDVTQTESHPAPASQQAKAGSAARELTPEQKLFRDIRDKYAAAQDQEALDAAMHYHDMNASEIDAMPDAGKKALKSAQKEAIERVTANQENGNG